MNPIILKIAKTIANICMIPLIAMIICYSRIYESNTLYTPKRR